MYGEKSIFMADMERVVLICHYRTGRTDGVSLEIDKRAAILKELGWKVYLLAGTGSDGADFVVPELDFDRNEVRKITNNSFGSHPDYTESDYLVRDIRDLASRIYKKLKEIVSRVNPDRILIHNIFSHGRHIASALAFYMLLKDTGIQALATHHDFYWEREDFKNPSCEEISSFLKMYIPPELPNLMHAVISTRAAILLKERTGIEAAVIPDTLDFSMPLWVKDDYNRDFPDSFGLNEDDVYILQATRIVKRKGLELMIPILEQLNKAAAEGQFSGKTLYNGKSLSKASRFVYLIAGYAEQEAQKYHDSIISTLKSKGIPYKDIQPRIAAERGVNEEGKKIYSLFDTYVFSDLVSYPSVYEGWGNQFIEAVFAQKPIAAFEYPVFLTDIKPKGYSYISLGSDFLRDQETSFYKLPPEKVETITKKIISVILSPNTNALLKANFELGKRYNSREILKKSLQEILE